MDQNMKDLLESVNFIKDNMATKDDLIELEKKVDVLGENLNKKIDVLRGDMQAGFTGVSNRTGGLDNRIDDETFARKDLENRVRTVVPNLPLAPERV